MPASTDELPTLPQTLETLTASELREIILALCTPGRFYKGFVEDIADLVKHLEDSTGRTNNRDGLPLHLFALNNEELRRVILQISYKNDTVRNQAGMMVEQIVAAKNSNRETIKGQKSPRVKMVPVPNQSAVMITFHGDVDSD